MRDGGIAAAILVEMKERAGEQHARRWAALLGLRQAMNDSSRRDDIAFAVGLLNAKAPRVEVRDRLIARGVSLATAKRRISDALAQRGLHREPSAGKANDIATPPPKP